MQQKIPRIIHQIWLGSDVPQKFHEMMNSWKGWKGWTYILWTDKDVESLNLYNRDSYEKAYNFGERADILRYELLKKFGGLYVDVDFACLDPEFFQFANQQYDFYVGIEPIEHEPISCCNALMASAPGHPLIQKIVRGVEKNIEAHRDELTFERTGPRFISRIIYSNLHLLKEGILFPPTFFYPIMGSEIEALHLDQNRFIRPETVAIHFGISAGRRRSFDKT